MKFKNDAEDDDKLDWQSSYFNVEKNETPSSEKKFDKVQSCFGRWKEKDGNRYSFWFMTPERAMEVCIGKIRNVFQKNFLDSSFYKKYYEKKLAALDRLDFLCKNPSPNNWLNKDQIDTLFELNSDSNLELKHYKSYWPEEFKANFKKITGSEATNEWSRDTDELIADYFEKTGENLGFLKFKPEKTYTKKPYTTAKPGDLGSLDFQEAIEDEEGCKEGFTL